MSVHMCVFTDICVDVLGGVKRIALERNRCEGEHSALVVEKFGWG